MVESPPNGKGGAGGTAPRARKHGAGRLGVTLAVLVALLGLTGALVLSGRMTALPGLEVHPEEGRAHVPEGTRVQYASDPPTSGPHYDRGLTPGFYDRPADPRVLLHNLEQGHVVIYYDPRRLSPDDRAALQAWTQRYRGRWEAVVAVPRPDPRYAVILTAWRHALRLPAYDDEVVARFIDRFRGRGPVNPVR